MRSFMFQGHLFPAKLGLELIYIMERLLDVSHACFTGCCLFLINIFRKSTTNK